MLKKTVPIILCCLLCSVSLSYACDMMALIAREGRNLGQISPYDHRPDIWAFNDVVDYFGFAMSRSSLYSNNDGYGVLYYPGGQINLRSQHHWYKYVLNSSQSGRVYYTGNYFNPTNQPDILDTAAAVIMNPANNAAIVMCHLRNASTNPFAPGNHPFRLTVNNRTYALMHNGTLSYAARSFMINYINSVFPDWFINNLPCYSAYAGADSPYTWIDSEVLFHYLMVNVIQQKGEVLWGLRQALKNAIAYVEGAGGNVMNIVLCDGERLYVFRNSYHWSAHEAFNLSIRQVGNWFYSVRTGMARIGDKQLNQYELVVLSRNNLPLHFPNFTRQSYNLPRFLEPPADPALSRITQLNAASASNGINIYLNLSNPSRVQVDVFNLKGQFVCKVMDNYFSKGSHKLFWNSRDQRGNKTAKGKYLIKVVLGKKTYLKKVSLL